MWALIASKKIMDDFTEQMLKRMEDVISEMHRDLARVRSYPDEATRSTGDRIAEMLATAET
ncbi:protein of unknown function (plasmid) [Pararobbsia alpina]